MPPKKKTNTEGADEATGGKFSWEGPNDTKLLILTQGRYVKPDEYEQLSSAFPGTSIGSIRNRVSALRVKQRDLYEALGWTLPESGASKKGAGATGTPAKRKKTGEDSEETPSKKARGKKKTAAAKSEDGGEGSGGEVKEEQVEDDV